MGRKRISATFPPWVKSAGHPPMRSPWVDESLEQTACLEPVLGAARADICIVGGGFTGLWTAYRLLEQEPAASVCLVEADQCGTGASGRNSGAAGDWWTRLPALVGMFGDDGARHVLSASIRAVVDIRSFVHESGFPCGLRQVRSVWSMHLPDRVAPWEAVFRTAERLGLEPPFRRLAPDELHRMFAQGPYFAGVVNENATRLQPALLARALCGRAREMGCRIYERSPVNRIEAHDSHVLIETEQGRIEAQHVVLAANAWMAHLDEFRPRVHVTSSDVVMTDPIPNLLMDVGIAHRPGGTNTRQMVNYTGRTPDGRIYVGRGGGALAYGGYVTPTFHWSAKRSREVERDFRILYPELNAVPIARSWAGPIDRSTTGLPFFGRLDSDERISYGIGYSGHGVGAAAIGGRILASLLLKRNDEWHDLNATMAKAENGRFPPEPVRFFIGSLVRDAVARKERSELVGRPPFVGDRVLAKFANVTSASHGNIR